MNPLKTVIALAAGCVLAACMVASLPPERPVLAAPTVSTLFPPYPPPQVDDSRPPEPQPPSF